jgi:hypothetical protein
MTIAAPLPPTGVMSLGLAIVSTSAAPLLLLDGTLMVLAGSSSFCREFEIDPAAVSNRRFSNLVTVSGMYEASRRCWRPRRREAQISTLMKWT